MSGQATVRALQDAAVAEAQLADAISASFARELEQAMVLLNRHIRRLILALEVDGRGLVSTRANLARALALRSQLLAALEDAGLPALSKAAIDAPLDRLAQTVLDNQIGRAATLTPFDVEALGAFKELRLAQLLSIQGDAAATVLRTVVDGVMGARPLTDLLEDIEDVLDVSAKEARTFYDTAVSAYSRQVDQIHTSGALDELFVYVGPMDIVTRPFCRAHVGKVYDREAISEMDNGQLPDVLITGGGYNCRHAWKPVSVLDDELIALHKTGGRIPFVADQVARVPERRKAVRP